MRGLIYRWHSKLEPDIHTSPHSITSFSDTFSDVISLTNAAEGRVIYKRGNRKQVSCQQIAICLPSNDMKVLESRDTLIGLSRCAMETFRFVCDIRSAAASPRLCELCGLSVAYP
jgi:hypothetical protein